MISAYNLVLLAFDAAGLGLLRRTPTLRAAGAITSAIGLAGCVMAAIFGGDAFGILGLAAWVVFLHVPAVLLGSSVILWRPRRMGAVAAATVSATLLVVACDGFLIEPFGLEVSHLEIVSGKISRPVRIVVVADFQAEAIGPYERGVIERVKDEAPDIVLLAGDYLQVGRDEWPRVREQFTSLLRKSDLGAAARVFAVRGNIDHDGWRDLFAGLGITVVEQTASFRAGELQLTCLSLQDSHSPMGDIVSPDPEAFHLVLGHMPDFALGPVEADLLVAGHTHGGQVRLPLVGPLMTNCRVPRAWAAGNRELPSGGRLAVSRGIGMERHNAPRLRFLCRPELVVIDLVPRPKQGGE